MLSMHGEGTGLLHQDPGQEALKESRGEATADQPRAVRPAEAQAGGERREQ